MSDPSNAGGSPLMERPVNGAIDDKSTPNGTSDIEKTAAEAKPENGAADSKSKSESKAKPDTDATRTITGLRWILVCVPLYVSIFVYGLDATIAADVQSPIVEAFGHVEQLAWIGFGFPLGSVAVISLCGVMYTKFNMKWSYIASLIVFEVGSALCGAAPNMGALIVGRVIAGAGGSGLYMGCLNLFTSFTSPQERGTYITGTGISWGVGAVLGPVIGGCFTSSSVTWRFAFYINLIIAAVFTPPTLFALPSVNPSPGVSIMDRLKKVDFLGLLLGIGVWVCFTMAFTMAGGQWPWDDGRTIGTIVAFAVIFVLWAIQQTFCILTTAEDRSIPVHLLRHRSQILLYMATSSTITSLFIIVYYIPIYFQFVHGDTALEAAVRLLPYIAVTVTLNLGSGHLLSKVKYYKPIYVVSGVFIILGGCLLTAYLDPSTSEGYIYGFTVLTAVGSGLTLQVGYAVASLKAHGQEGGALALQNIAQIGGSVIALVIAGQVFQSYAVRDLSKVLAGTGYTKTDIHSIVAGAQSQLFQQLDETLKKQATLAITKAMQRSFILVCVGGGVHLIVSLLMKREKLFD